MSPTTLAEGGIVSGSALGGTGGASCSERELSSIEVVFPVESLPADFFFATIDPNLEELSLNGDCGLIIENLRLSSLPEKNLTGDLVDGGDDMDSGTSQ